MENPGQAARLPRNSSRPLNYAAPAQAVGVAENIAVCAADYSAPGEKTVVSRKKTMSRRFGFMVSAAGTIDIAVSMMVDRKKTMVSATNTVVCAIIIMVFAAANVDFAANTMVGAQNTVVAGAGTMVSGENIMVEEPETTVFFLATVVEETKTMVFFLPTMIPAPSTTTFSLANIMRDAESAVRTAETSVRRKIQGQCAASHATPAALHQRGAANPPVGFHATPTRNRRMTASAPACQYASAHRTIEEVPRAQRRHLRKPLGYFAAEDVPAKTAMSTRASGS